jgi:hypothetical protein
MKITDAQRAALALLADDMLVRWQGGWWAHAKEPVARKQWPTDHDVPTRSTTIQTLRALEKRGLARRVESGLPEWRDPRRITPAGRAALAEVVS